MEGKKANKEEKFVLGWIISCVWMYLKFTSKMCTETWY